MLADKVEKLLLQTLSTGDMAMLENFGEGRFLGILRGRIREHYH
jgi:hypothetical protein